METDIIKPCNEFLGSADVAPAFEQLIMLVEGNVVDEDYFDDFNIDAIDFKSSTLSYLNKYN